MRQFTKPLLPALPAFGPVGGVGMNVCALMDPKSTTVGLAYGVLILPVPSFTNRPPTSWAAWLNRAR